MDLKVTIGGTTFRNPVWTASGTFGNGEEFLDFVDLKKVGAVITKTVTLKAREGNPPPRIVETSSGLLNSIGLENKGLNNFLKEQYPSLRKLKTKFIVSIARSGQNDLVRCAEKLAGEKPDAIELNLSCPNVRHGGTRHRLTAQDARQTEKMVASVRRVVKCPVIAKLTPDVTDIGEIAQAAESGGADAVSVVNTYPGMAVDAEEMKPVLGNVVGGLSGPAIKPMALKAVRDVYDKVRIPVVGIGGIMTGIDVAEFMLCGASAVQIGTANLVDPDAYERILDEFVEYLDRKKIKKTASLTGRLWV